MFRPVLVSSGLPGWQFLQATYDRQIQGFSQSAAIRNDRDYLVDALSQPLTKEALLEDPRLLRTTLTAFGLGSEAWKRGFISKVLDEAADPQSTFLARLNNPQYSRFAEAFATRSGTISLDPDRVLALADDFVEASFEVAVGEIDNDMRLSLTFRSEIGDLVTATGNEQAVLFRLLGNVPMRTVLESALNLPSDMRRLPIERQAEILKDGLSRRLGVRDVTSLAEPGTIDTVLRRFHAVQALTQGPQPGTPGSVALTLLSGIGSAGSQNLFLSNFG